MLFAGKDRSADMVKTLVEKNIGGILQVPDRLYIKKGGCFEYRNIPLFYTLIYCKLLVILFSRSHIFSMNSIILCRMLIASRKWNAEITRKSTFLYRSGLFWTNDKRGNFFIYIACILL